MQKEILDFLNKEPVGVLTVMMADGAPHAATIHFSNSDDLSKFFMQTTNDTVKVKNLLDGKTTKAAMAIGFSEKDWLEMQMHGDIRIVSDANEVEALCKVHYGKHPGAEKYKGPTTVFLEFVPTWWRFSDFNTEPETIIEKEKGIE